MKITFLTAFTTVAFLFFQTDLRAAEQKDIKTQLQELVTAVRTKVQAGKTSETNLAPELKQFEAILTEHKSEKTDDVAEVLFMEAMLYLQVMENPEKGEALLKRLQENFPNTGPGKRVEEVLAGIQQQAEAQKVRKTLIVGAPFPDFSEKDLKGKPLSIANYRGKIVLIDFWATWCGPCVGELPNVLKTYGKYHDQGFEIIGISLDKDAETLASFLEKKGMTWPQYFDGKGWQNKLAAKYGVESIPATYLLDGDGKIVAKNLRGEALVAEVGKLVGKKSSGE